MPSPIFRRILLIAGAALCSAAVAVPPAVESLGAQLAQLVGVRAEPSVAPAAGTVEYGFSPDGGAEQLVIKVIGTSQRQLRVMAYSLTSAPVVRALIAAKKRGVDVAVVADHEHNALQDRSGKARAALNALANSGIAVRTVSAYAIHHDKVVIADGSTVQTGSFNYSAAAAKSNSENVLVLWGNQEVARGYLQHFERNWRKGKDWQPGY